MKAKQKLSIIVPVYNEEKTILEIYKTIKEGEVGIDKEIIIVDDGSTDGTKEKLRQIKEKDTKIIFQERNKGKGAAIRRGLEEVTGTITLIQDADLEYDPRDYKSIIDPILKKRVKVVYGSRRLRKTNEQYASFAYYVGGIVLTKITNILYGSSLTDEATCYKAFDTALLKELHLECERFEFCPEVTAKVLKKKLQIEEVPITYHPRSTEEGKNIRWKYGLEAVWTLIKWKWKKI